MFPSIVLKDYRAQFTEHGYRLVRCAVGDGCVPFEEIAPALAPHGSSLTASIELGALETRHIRVFDTPWWTGYPPREARELATALGRLQRRRIESGDDPRTPWEVEEPQQSIVDYETNQVAPKRRQPEVDGLDVAHASRLAQIGEHLATYARDLTALPAPGPPGSMPPDDRQPYARIPFTTWAGSSTPTSFWSRPWWRKVKVSWFRPKRCRMVACRSRWCTGSFAML